MTEVSQAARDLEQLAARVEAADANDQRRWLAFAADRLLTVATFDRFRTFLDAEAYESAAMTLVPEGWSWAFYSGDSLNRPDAMLLIHGEPASAVRGEAATPVLAITAASLRARRAMDDLVEKVARAIRDVKGGVNYDYMDFCRDAAEAALDASGIASLTTELDRLRAAGDRLAGAADERFRAACGDWCKIVDGKEVHDKHCAIASAALTDWRGARG